jgi:hypothetical protein
VGGLKPRSFSKEAVVTEEDPSCYFAFTSSDSHAHLYDYHLSAVVAEGGFTSIYVGPGAPGDIHAGFDEGKVFHTVFLSVTGSVS